MLMKNPQVRSRTATVLSALTGLVAVVALLAGTVAVASQLLASPFRTTQVDRTLPPVLVELRDLSDVHTAQGQFAVTVDVEQDVSWVPS